MSHNSKFSILITTKNRIDDLVFTLKKIKNLLQSEDVECLICDDGSTDGSFEYLKKNYPKIQLIQNKKSKGLIFSRNKLLNLTTSEFAISLDDDAHFLSNNPLELIENYFNQNPKCGVIGLRVFWNLYEPQTTFSEQKPQRMQGFVGCAHVWRMSSWRLIPNYPEWFVFYGEEEFAAFQLFKKDIEVHYLPSVLVQHRVDVKSRKNSSDYTIRLRRSLRSGWYLFFMFLPISQIPKKMAYSIWMQLKLKVFRGDFKALKALCLGFLDLIINFRRIIKYKNRLTNVEFEKFLSLPPTIIYWNEE